MHKTDTGVTWSCWFSGLSAGHGLQQRHLSREERLFNLKFNSEQVLSRSRTTPSWPLLLLAGTPFRLRLEPKAEINVTSVKGRSSWMVYMRRRSDGKPGKLCLILHIPFTRNLTNCPREDATERPQQSRTYTKNHLYHIQ